MNYFDPYPLCVDETVTTAWKSQLADAENMPWLARTLAGQASELFPRFAAAYTNLRSMPRAARRSLQRQLARSRDVFERAPQGLQRGEGQRLRYKLARSLAGAALLLALGQSVQAATITVTTNKPEINDGDNKCSLIEAIINANNDAATHRDCLPGSGADTIVLPPGSMHMLTGPLTNYHGYTGLPVITSPITIQGNGSQITRKKSRKLNRLIAVASTGDLSLSDVTLTNGVEFYGGAVYNRGKVAITNCTISGGISYFGAGLFNGAGGNAVINSSTFTRNTALYGGGITNHQGTVTVSNSTISSNKVVDHGGGVATFDGNLSINDSVVTGNTARGLGGGLMIYGTLTIDNCVISNNAAIAGGGMSHRSYAPLAIINSTISGNRTRYHGGGIENWGNMSVDKSTISGNRARDVGGGIAHFHRLLTITNSTISGNTARKEGGGLWNQTHATIVSNTTISANAARAGGGIFNTFSFDTGLFLERSLVSGNKAPIDAREVYNWSSNGGKVASNGFNVFGGNGQSGISGIIPDATDVLPGVPVASILAPLANNGGPTMTHALVPGSPAIDTVPGADPECTGTDQRGTPRPQGAGCDIGAFER